MYAWRVWLPHRDFAPDARCPRQLGDSGCMIDRQQQLERSCNMKKTAVLVALLMLGVLAGCNTMQGMGRDIERGGEKLQGTAKDTQEKM
jgi:entericidin B